MFERNRWRAVARVIVIVILPVTAVPASAFGATSTWNGGAGNWSDASKWTPQSAPNQVDVVIDGKPATASTVEMDVAMGATANALTIDTGDTLSLSQSNRYLTLFGNALINGRLTMAGSNVRLIMAGGGSKTIGGSGEIQMLVGQGGIDPGFNWGTNITIGPNFTIRGGGGVSVATNNGTFLAENALAAYGVNNRGLMRATGTGSLQLYDSWDNDGTISLDDGTYLTLGGTFETEDIGTINRGANTTIGLTGKWNNAGRDVDLSASIGSILLNTGTITGGRIGSSGDARLLVFGYQGANTLDGVTLATSPVFVDSGRQLTVVNALALDNITIDLSDGANNRSSNRLTGGSLSGTGTIVLGTLQAAINADNHITTSTIGPGLLVRGSGIVTAINQGTIRADIAGAKLQLWHVENDGLVHATNNSRLEVSSRGSRPFVNRGVVRVDAGSSFNVPTDQSLTQTAGSLCVNGVLTTQAYKLVLGGGIVSGSGIITATPSTIAPRVNFGGTISPGASDDGQASISALTIATNLSFAGGSHYLAEIDGLTADLLKLNGGATFAGDLDIAAGTFLDIRPSGNLLYDTPYLVATYAGTRTGAFEQVTPNFVVDYSVPHAIYVTALVPEPTSSAMVFFAGAGAAAKSSARRRRRTAQG